MKKQYFLAPALLIVALLVSACGSAADSQPDQETVAVTLAMGFIPNIQFAPFYVADQRGYFAEEGIEITFESMFEDQSVPLVGTNELQFAIVSAEQVILARAQGLPVVYVAKWWDKFPIAIVAKTEAGIDSPVDLAGRTVGLPGLYGASYIGLRALLNTQGLGEADINLETIDFTQVQSLATDTVEAVVVYANNEPIQLTSQGYEISIINVSDYVNLASNGLVANETVIGEQPELVRAMARAMLRGLADVIADPDAAYQVALEYVETLSADDTVQPDVLLASIEMWRTERPGASDLAAWEATQEVLLSMGMLAEPIDLDTAFTNEFIP